eukprot:m.345590 g.345590  ORF g.345590 m.345590 type:complete len:74 (+) comp16560_c1_seq3:2454-2675(+)
MSSQNQTDQCKTHTYSPGTLGSSPAMIPHPGRATAKSAAVSAAAAASAAATSRPTAILSSASALSAADAASSP